MEHDISFICKVLKVSRSSYYYHNKKSKELTKRELEEQTIKCKIVELHQKADKRLGPVKMQDRLAKHGITIGVGRVIRLMNKMNLPKMSTSKPPKQKRTKEDGEETGLFNILHRNFNASAPNQKWVSDITYIKAEGRWYYLCIIMDLFGRKIIAYKIGSRINRQLVIDTFRLAYRKRGFPSGVIFHSDRGSQYISKDFKRELDEANFVASYSKRGNPYDNAVAEAFFRFLKTEEVYRRVYVTKKQMEFSIFNYIEGFYNNDRPHSANQNMSPNEKERHYVEQRQLLFLKSTLEKQNTISMNNINSI